MNDVLIEEMSPFGNIVAYAEDDGRTVYFYLYFRDAPDGSEEKIKSCWVRNRVPGTSNFNTEAMLQGQAPLMPTRFCRSPTIQTPLERSNLRIVWLEEADAAALLEGDSILAIIPAWSGMQGFWGYARDCIGEGPTAWELTADNVARARVGYAEDFWKLWNDKSFWQSWRDARIADVENVIGPHSKYYAIDGDEFPPRAVLRFDSTEAFIFVTIGISLFSQPKVELYFEDPSPHRRIELAACIDRSCPDSEMARFAQYMSAQARYPWTQFTPLGFGHTMPCDSTPVAFGGEQFNFVLFSESLSNTPHLVFPTFRGDPINLLWMFPITEKERELAIDSGSPELTMRLASAGHDIVIRKRQPVVK